MRSGKEEFWMRKRGGRWHREWRTSGVLVEEFVRGMAEVFPWCEFSATAPEAKVSEPA
jgi:hypothetical protein